MQIDVKFILKLIFYSIQKSYLEVREHGGSILSRNTICTNNAISLFAECGNVVRWIFCAAIEKACLLRLSL